MALPENRLFEVNTLSDNESREKIESAMKSNRADKKIKWLLHYPSLSNEDLPIEK